MKLLCKIGIHNWGKNNDSFRVCSGCGKKRTVIYVMTEDRARAAGVSEEALDDLRAKLDNLTTASKAAFHEMICTCNGELDCAKCKLFQLLENRND